MNTKTVDLERVELAAREQWQSDPTLRADFCDDLDSFIAFQKADARGLVRIFGRSNREERK